MWNDRRFWVVAAAVLGCGVWFGFELKLTGFLGVILAFAVVAFAAGRAAVLCYHAKRLQQMALSAVISIGCAREVLLVQTDKGPPLTLAWAILAFVTVGIFWHMGLARRRGKLPVRKFRVVESEVVA